MYKTSALQEIPNTHMQSVTFIVLSAQLLKVDILTNLLVQDGIFFFYLSTYQMANIVPLKMSVALLMKNKPGKWHVDEWAKQNVRVDCCWLDKWVAIYTIFYFPQQPQGPLCTILIMKCHEKNI